MASSERDPPPPPPYSGSYSSPVPVDDSKPLSPSSYGIARAYSPEATPISTTHDTSQAIQQGSQSLPLLVGQQGLQDATTDLPFVSNRWHSNKFRWSRLWLAYTSPSLVIGIGFLVWGITGRENPFNSEKNISSSAMILAIGPILVVGAYWINCFFDREGFPAEHFARLNTLFFQSFAIIGLLVWFLVW